MRLTLGVMKVNLLLVLLFALVFNWRLFLITFDSRGAKTLFSLAHFVVALRPGHGLDDDLSDAIASRQRDRLLRVRVEEADLHFSSIARIDRARRIDHRHPRLDRKTRPWPHLHLEPHRDCHTDTRRTDRPAHRGQRQPRLPLRLGEVRAKVRPCRPHRRARVVQ